MSVVKCRCADGWIRVYCGDHEGWDECSRCHGTGFVLPPFPTPEQLAEAKAQQRQDSARKSWIRTNAGLVVAALFFACIALPALHAVSGVPALVIAARAAATEAAR